MSELKERTYARGVALQILYEKDMSSHPLNIIIQDRFETLDLDENTEEFVEAIVHGVDQNTAAIDKMIENDAPDWPIDQVAVIDRNIIRISVWEFALEKCTPVSVAINEAVELAKKFGSESSQRFVNGVLGSIAEKAH